MMVYTELGRLPLYISRNIRIVKYWIKLLNTDNCILKECYATLYDEGKEGNVLFNDSLNTFYLRLYSERGNPLPPHGLLFPISSQGSSHKQDNTYHSLCYTNRGSLAGTRNSSMDPP